MASLWWPSSGVGHAWWLETLILPLPGADYRLALRTLDELWAQTVMAPARYDPALDEAERVAHEARVATLRFQLGEKADAIAAAEVQLRAAQSVLDKQRADSGDINKYLELQLEQQRQLVEDAGATLAEEQEEALRGRTELRCQIDAEELAAESRHASNQSLLAQNRQGVAFVPEYEALAARNATKAELLAAKKAELATLSADLALKRLWSGALSAASLGSDESGRGALPALTVELMRAFPLQELLQEQALTVLSALLADEEGHNARRIHQAGGVPLILAALRAQAGAGDGGVATQACSLLWMLALSSRQACEELAAHDALPLLVEILRAHLGASRLVVNCCGAICHLLVTRPRSLGVAAQIGAQPSLERADVHAHPALKRRARATAEDEDEVRRRLGLMRVGHGSSPARVRALSPVSASVSALSERSPSPSAQLAGGRRTGARKSSAAWQHELLVAAVAKLTRSERAGLPTELITDPEPAPRLATREPAARAAMGALLDAMRAHPAEAKALEYALCAVWNLLLSSAPLAREFAQRRGPDAPLGLARDALSAHARSAGVVAYAIAALLAVVELPEAVEGMAELEVGALVQQVARSHTRNVRLQEGAVSLLEALDRAAPPPGARGDASAPGWTAATHAHWLHTAAELRGAFAELAPDSTALYRCLSSLRSGYHRLGRIYRHYTTGGSGWRDAPLGAPTLGLREWQQLAKACRLATRSFGAKELERVFLTASRKPAEGAGGERALHFVGFVRAAVLVAFGRLNPFAAEWLLGRAADVPLVPLDEAVSHLLQEHLFAPPDMAPPGLMASLVSHEMVTSAARRRERGRRAARRLTPSHTPPRRALAPRLLQAESAVSAHGPLLLKLFRKYASRNSAAATHVVLADAMHLLRGAGALALGRLTAREVCCAFADCLPDLGVESLHEPDRPEQPSRHGLEFPSFVQCLCRCAVNKLAVAHSDATPATADAAAAHIAELVADVVRAYNKGVFDSVGTWREPRTRLPTAEAAPRPARTPPLDSTAEGGLDLREHDDAEVDDDEVGEEL